MGIFDLLGDYLIPFLIVLTVLVFVHELGHYLVARWNGVRVEVFSIGFGPEIFGWTASSGTRWKISAVPLGGYVRMFGDANEASTPSGALTTMSQEERDVSFHHKRLGQRAAIVAAGPIANFLFAIVVLAGLFIVHGQPYTPATVGEVVEGSAADAAGFQPGDTIIDIDGRGIDRFEEVQQIVSLSPETTMVFTVERFGEPVQLQATPESVEIETRVGTQRIGRLGISREGGGIREHGPISALGAAVVETWSLTGATITAVSQIITGDRGAEELGGPLRIAQMSGEVAQVGVATLVWFMAVLSINLGLINLFPIPMLDGGHLLFYAFEAIRGRPLGERAQEYGFRIGLVLVLSLMVFATWNDLVHLDVMGLIRSLVS